jgi:DNA-binding MarR family transcriptional regulator
MHDIVGRMTEGEPATPGEQVAQALGDLLRRSARSRVYGALTEGLGPALDESTYPVLSGLARTGSHTAAQLAADVGLDRSVVSRHADRLEAAGLLRRQPDPADRRATLLVLTGDGQRAVTEMRGRLAAQLDDYLAAWPAADAAAFARALLRFTEDLTELLSSGFSVEIHRLHSYLSDGEGPTSPTSHLTHRHPPRAGPAA